ncbi:MAG: metal ABC transporter ATP-binding protein [Micropruina sp.]|nr:metal ABC transporter ATP-binding protein [Micropruina sp.]
MSDPLAVGRELVLAYSTHVAVEPSDFTIPQGVTTIIGPNGSGKSTLLNALAGTIDVRAGSLEIFGEPAPAPHDKLSYVMQSLNVAEGTPITVREVVAMGCYPKLGWFGRFQAEDRRRIDAALARLEVTDLADRHLSELSGGQRQRVYVAQGIVQLHDVLLLDEPLTGLDLVSARIIDDLIHTERENGHSVILTTHDLDEARASDWVVLMSGRVIACGPPDQVLSRHNLEIAYGLGALHGTSGEFADDPDHAHSTPPKASEAHSHREGHTHD